MKILKFLVLILIFNSCQKKSKPILSEKALTFEYLKTIYITEKESTYKFYLIENKDTIFIDEFNKNFKTKNVAVFSPVFYGAFKILNSQNTIKAIDKIDYYYDSFIELNYNQNKIIQLGDEGNFNFEKISQNNFDLIVCSQLSSYFQLKKKFPNIKVLPCISYLENHPLARAEWIKIFGLITQKIDSANLIFNQVKNDYLNIKKNQKVQKNFISENLFSGIWYVSGGNSYIAKLIKDAGGNYLFKHLDKKSSYPLSFEQIMRDGKNAEIWINAGVFKTKKELENSFSNYSKLKPFILGNIFNPIKKMKENGANDYWETGPYFPNLILKDYQNIIQNKSLDSLNFYLRLK